MKRPLQNVLTGTAVGFLVTAGLQWCWNTVAPLFAGPSVEFNHTLATLAMLFFVAGLLRPRHPAYRHCRGDRHET